MTDLPKDHQIGANNPPVDPFEAIRTHLSDLEVEARAWCDGEPITTQAQADEVSRLMEEFRKAHKAADDARVAENKPFDDGKAAVQERYAPLIANTKAARGITVRAQEALRALLTPYLRKLEDDKRAAAIEAQRVADAAAEAATAALRAANPTDLGAGDKVEELVAVAKAAQVEAKHAAGDKAHAHGGSRAVGLRSYWEPVLVDQREALRHYAARNPDELRAWLVEQAWVDVRSGRRAIPGFNVVEDRR